ncbi:hypothetical protein JYU34_001495 [Plutella xylostella]|uniref:Reverse transcriptase domain-containing protein n=1 Tax=Plutella xylostella TaxID=51655 RepID=A0ABQ7R423_PLUXY|nr:hypothetical protein JYU34_001495 [Plutella xylostella]
MNVLSECYDIIILTETWLIPTITDNLLIDSRYTVFRSDRDRVATGKKDGGGVLVAVRRGLQATRAALRPPPTAPEPLPVNIDCVTVELPSNKQGKHLFCSNCVVESCGPPLGALVPPDAQHPPLHALVPLHLCTKPMTSHKAPRYRFIEADYKRR